MKYVRVEPLEDVHGFHLDPDPYLAALPDLLPRLPPGAARFASDPGHYDLTGGRCVKDLELRGATLTDQGEELTLDLALAPNPWKHRGGLRLRYADVRSHRVDAAGADGLLPRLGAVLLDELLPHPAGLSHAWAFTCGTLAVVAADVTAWWEEPGEEPGDPGEGPGDPVE